jgi:ornithine cyclodeaminase/alanine dehydrogenase-like protein (mu-crystallin family)
MASLPSLPIIDGAEVARLLPYTGLVDALDAAHREPEALVRRVVYSPDGSDQLFMGLPAWVPGRAIGIKLVTSFPANTGTDLPTIQALYVLFDGTNGSPLALIDGTELTYRKTACDSALGSRYLSRTDARTLLMVGAGGLGEHLIAAHRAVRPSIERVLVWNRGRDRADALAQVVGGTAVDDLDAAVAEADIISTATRAKEPLIKGALLRGGTHLDLVGSYLPDSREIDDDVVRRARLYVDSRLAPLEECGDLVIPLRAGLITEDDIVADLYQLARGERQGRTDAAQITAMENGGGGHLDLMTARFVWAQVQAGA